MWGIFFGEFQCLPVDDCSAVSCDSGALTRGSERMSFYSAILNQSPCMYILIRLSCLKSFGGILFCNWIQNPIISYSKNSISLFTVTIHFWPENNIGLGCPPFVIMGFRAWWFLSLPEISIVTTKYQALLPRRIAKLICWKKSFKNT